MTVHVTAASRSVLHAEACSPPIFNSAVTRHHRKGFPSISRPVVGNSGTVPEADARIAMKNMSNMGEYREDVLPGLGWKSHHAPEVYMSEQEAGIIGPHPVDNSIQSKVYASADMAPQLYVSLSGKFIAPHHFLPEVDVHRGYHVRSGIIAGARLMHSGPLAPMVPPDHLEPAGKPHAHRPPDMRQLNYTPMNLERFAHVRHREAKRALAEAQEATQKHNVRRKK